MKTISLRFSKFQHSRGIDPNFHLQTCLTCSKFVFFVWSSQRKSKSFSTRKEKLRARIHGRFTSFFVSNWERAALQRLGVSAQSKKEQKLEKVLFKIGVLGLSLRIVSNWWILWWLYICHYTVKLAFSTILLKQFAARCHIKSRKKWFSKLEISDLSLRIPSNWWSLRWLYICHYTVKLPFSAIFWNNPKLDAT